MSISLIFGFIVLLVFTQNIILTIFSVFSIAGIISSVVAIMELKGWQLGIAESLTVVILIGLSVDYVIHIANHYLDSLSLDRYKKT